jgi:hypothetical protein
MMTSISHNQATKLAALVASLRPDWHTAGIVDAIAKARDIAPAADLACAAIRAAADQSNRTPAVIAMEGPHWRGADATPRFERPPAGERCSICNLREVDCRTKWRDDHRFLSVAMARRTKVEGHIDRSILAPPPTPRETTDA